MDVRISTNKLWNKDNHCMILFNYPKNGNLEEAGDLTLVYRSKDLVPTTFLETLKSQHWGNYELVDYNQLSSRELLDVLANVLGIIPNNIDIDPRFVLTMDNMLKMIAIHIRVYSGIPGLLF
jgi:hypothetical protein